MERVIPTQLADLYPHLDVVESTGSTNADLLASDAPHGAVLIARHQSAGRGRRGRPWSAPADTQLIFSVLLRVTDADVARLGTLPLAAGVAVTDVVAPATLKWPNDVLIDGRKLCGILAEGTVEPGLVVVGAGVNTAMAEADLPVPTATSFAALGATCDEDRLLADYLTALDASLTALARTGGDAVASGALDALTARCVTLGQEVRVSMPDGSTLEGLAEAIDPTGRLVVRTPSGPHPVSAGDVVHVRPA